MMADCTSNGTYNSGLYCPAYHDSFQCWPDTAANTTVYQPCPDSTNLGAFRVCTDDGTWETNETNYMACLDTEDYTNYILLMVLKEIIFITSIISLLFLIVSLFIFCYFRSIQCNRISIHKHLVMAFIINFTIMVYQTQPEYPTYRNVEWSCKTVLALSKWSQMATFSWMLVEGIYLHNRLVVTVFPSSTPFRLFYFIGWGLPVAFTGLWAGLMYMEDKSICWDTYTRNKFVFILFVPIMLALLINCAFLVNIIRVLITKLRNNNLMESRRIRKAIKATVILLPLLGVANLLFLAQPGNDKTVVSIAQVVNALLPACQGIFVSVLYCFINTEVRSAIKKKWRRCLTNRALNTRTRRQGSRTSSNFLSQSEAPIRRSQTLRPAMTRDRDYHSMTILNFTPALNSADPELDIKKVAL